MLEDVHYALRGLQRRPFLAVVTALTLGVGIGSAATVFSVVDAVVLRALPFDEPDRLVRVWELTPERDRFSVSARAYQDLAATSRSLQSVAAYSAQAGTAVMSDGGSPQRLTAVPVSASFSAVLGVQPQLGRMFSVDDERPTAGVRRLVIANSLWQSRFRSDAAIVGRMITVDGQPHEVIGVMPAGFDFPGGADAWVPLVLDPNADHTDKALEVMARLAPGVTHAQVAGELREIAARWSREYPAAHDGWSAEAVSFNEWIISPRFRDAVWMLFGAVALLLLLACVNVANLLVARAVSRQDEMRVRAALGAGRGRIVKQLLAESAVIAALGTATGLLLAIWLIEAVRALGGNTLPRLDSLSLNTAVILFACVAGIVSCLTFGLAPALYASRVNLRGGVDGVRTTSRSTGLRQVLVVAEVAIAMLLVVGAGLLGNSFVRLMQVDPGFDVEATLAMPVTSQSSRYPEDRAADFYRDVLERVRAMPGVVAAGATTTDPFRQFGFSNDVTPEERAADAPASGLVQAGWRSVTPGFFEAMGIPILAGRGFSEADRDGAETVVVISEELARRLWPGESPIGKRIYWGGTTGRTRLVVGVSGDIRDVQLDAVPPPMLFVPHAQVSVPQMTVVIRTTLPMEQIAAPLREVFTNIDPSLPPPAVHSVASSRAESTRAPRFNLSLLVAFAGVALVLALTGVYAMLAFMVSERRRELAVRLALGATGADVARQVLGRGMQLSLGGVVLGAAGALAAAAVLSNQLYAVAPTDPVTFMGAALSLLAAAALASYLPARQASRVDAAALLRRDV
jgi:predicted permease